MYVCVSVWVSVCDCKCLWPLIPLELELQVAMSWVWYGCWELNSGPLEEQYMFLTTKPSL